jgi:type I restriction enzyme S subunit
MRNGWTETTLGEITEVVMGRQLSPSKKLGLRPTQYLRAANIGSWGISLDDVLEMDFTEDEEVHFASRVGDVLLVEGGNEKSVGCPALISEREEGLCIQNTIIRCRIKDDVQVFPEFLFQVLRNSFWLGKFSELCAGTTIMHLGQKRAQVFPLILPPLDEQKRIVDLVSSVDSYIATLQRQAYAARAARSAVLSELLSAGGDDWTEITLGDVVTLEYGKPLKAEDRDGTGFPVFGSAGEVGLHSIPLVGDAPVIIVGRKGTAGAVWWSDLPCSVIDTAYFVIPKAHIDPRFLYLELGHLDLPALTAQTGVPGLNRDRAYSCRFQLPPIAEQQRIVKITSSIDEILLGTENAVTAARKLRVGLLSDLLSGEHEIPETYDRLLGAA